MKATEDIISENIGIALVKTQRKQQELALELGVSKNRMSDILNRRAYLSAVELYKVATFFGLDPAWFYIEQAKFEPLGIIAA